MSKAIGMVAGGLEIAGGIVLMATGIGVPAGVALLLSGITTEASAIAAAIGSKSGLGVTTRTPAQPRQIIRGVQRVGGTMVYCSTTGSSKRQYNMVIVVAGHECYAIENLYLDGRQVFWDSGSNTNTTRNGYNFGGNADGNNHTGPNGAQYNFGGLVFCSAKYGDQNNEPDHVSGTFQGTNYGFSTDLNANDGTWAQTNVAVGAAAVVQAEPDGMGGVTLSLDSGGWGYTGVSTVSISIIDLNGPGTGASGHGVVTGDSVTSVVLDAPGTGYVDPQATADPGSTVENTPYLAGCTWVYLKIEADAGTFPQFPEIRFTVHGKSDIYDPRTSARGFTTNWALHVADVLADSNWGLGDGPIEIWPTAAIDQLIAAANVCDESVSCAQGEEARYALNWHCDSSAAPGDQLQRMMPAAAGRLSEIGGGRYIWPAYWQGPSITFDENALLDAPQWVDKKPLSELYNRVTGTYIAPNFPYNVAGNLYDSNGFWNGETQNNFPYSFQPTDYPMYAADALHGYGEDVYLIADTPNVGTYSGSATYPPGAVVIYNGVPWQALDTATGVTPGSNPVYWQEAGNYLPFDLTQDAVLSISQAQRVAKIFMLRNRQQGAGTLVMSAAALQMQPIDVMQFSFPALSWTDKYLEVAGLPGQKLKVKFAAPPNTPEGADQVPAVYLEVPVNETDPSVYEDLAPGEELTATDMPAFSGAVNAYLVAAPTGVTIVNDAATRLVLSDGTSIARGLISWTPPADTYVQNGGSIQVQYAFWNLYSVPLPSPGPIRLIPNSTLTGPFGAGGATDTIAITDWVDLGTFSGQAINAYIDIPAGYGWISVQVRAVRSSGATSAWVQDSALVGGFPLVPGHPIPELKYGDGTTTIDSLKPLEIGANVTETRVALQANNLNNHTLDNLADGTVRFGAIAANAGAQFGQNVCVNPSLEIAPVSGSGDLAAGWFVQNVTGGAFTVILDSSAGFSNSGLLCIMMRALAGITIPAGATEVAAVESRSTVPASAGQVWILKCFIRTDANVSTPAGLTYTASSFARVEYSDGSSSDFGTAGVTPATGAYQQVSSGPFTVPTPSGKTVTGISQWIALNVVNSTGSAVSSGSGNMCDARFDDISLVRVTSMDDELADGSTYQRMPISNMDSNRRGLIDFTQSGHISKTMDYIADGGTRFGAAEAGANVTSNHVLTAISVPSSNVALTNTVVSIPGFGWSLVAAGSSDVYNICGVIVASNTATGADAAYAANINLWIYIDGNPAGEYVIAVPEINSSAGGDSGTATGAFFASFTDLTAGAHTIQIYAQAAPYAFSSIELDAPATSGYGYVGGYLPGTYAICQRVF